MPILIPIALLGWIVIAAGLFTMMPARRAVLFGVIGGWLFLPEFQIGFQGIPDLSKATSIALGVLLGMMLFDATRLLRIRPSWVDLPIVVWCVVPFISAVVNRTGVYDGVSATLDQLVFWGIPWLIGRVYFCDLEGMRELAMGVLIGGMIYVPLCLYEVRMSPQFHKLLYGDHPSAFVMAIRWGGYRPMVFMQHGLMLGLWMTVVALIAYWLWATRAVKRVRSIPMGVIVVATFMTAVLCKSTGALALLMIGIGGLVALRHVRAPILAAIAIALPIGYIGVRISGVWDGQAIVDVAKSLNEERGTSLEGRLYHEGLLAEHAMEKKWFGWGTWGRWRITDEITGKDTTISDSMWIITLGQSGLIGLGSWLAVMLLPLVLLLRKTKIKWWSKPALAPTVALAVVLLLFTLDSMMNAMVSPVYMLIAGGLTGLYVTVPKRVLQAAAMAPRGWPSPPGARSAASVQLPAPGYRPPYPPPPAPGSPPHPAFAPRPRIDAPGAPVAPAHSP